MKSTSMSIGACALSTAPRGICQHIHKTKLTVRDGSAHEHWTYLVTFLLTTAVPRNALRLPRGCATECYRTLPGPLIAVQVDKFLLPVMRTRWIGWPFGKSIAERINALQNRLIGALLDVRMLSDEDLPKFMHLASALAAAQGTWSTRWAADIKRWDAHCRRNSSGVIWTNGLLRMASSSDLQRRRAQFAISSRVWSCFAGRTDTRRAPGSVQTRREDSIVAATQHLVESATECTLRILRCNLYS